MSFFYYMKLKSIALRQLHYLLRKGNQTHYGRYHHFSAIQTYEDFIAYAPLIEYKDIEPYIDQIKLKAKHVLWPGITDKFAVSSGTTGSGKHLPISHDRVKADLSFMRSVVMNILRKPDLRLFGGTHLSIVGSLERTKDYDIGEISAILAATSPKWIRFLQYPDPHSMIYEPWINRFETIIQTAIQRDIRVISGVPSWIYVLFKEAVKRSGRRIDQLWPNLCLIVTGGVALTSYIEVLNSYLGDLKPAFYENYGASEGYYAHGWFDHGWLSLKYDHGIFYEFIPKEDPNGSFQQPPILPLWEVKTDTFYQLVVTHLGLWRYKTNDLVEFKSSPYPTLRVVGRVNEMTDTHGEALSASEASLAIDAIPELPRPTHLHIKSSWHSSDELPFHEWILVYSESDQWIHLKDQNLQELSDKVDEFISHTNRHYAVRRQTGVLAAPKLTIYRLEEYASLLHALPKAQSKLPFFLKD
jgi:hypothetical protein